MPRNSFGDFTLVAGNPVATGTVIESNWANTTMGDIGNALTDSLSRSGKGSMSAPFQAINGGALLPSITFANFPKTGLYAASADDLRVTVNGIDRWRWLQANALPQTWDSVAGIWQDSGGGGITWTQQDVAPATADISMGYCTLGGQTILMPLNPPVGFSVAFADKANDWSETNFLTLDGNGSTFTQDGSAIYELDLKGAFAQFSFLEGQWQIVNFGRLSDAYGYDLDNYATLDFVNTKPNRNLLINGGFDIWQRGSGFSAAGYTADRWKTLPNIAVTKTIGKPSGAVTDYSLQATASSGAEPLMYSSVELPVTGQPLMFKDGAKFTISFWATAALGADIKLRLAFVDTVASSANRVVLYEEVLAVGTGSWQHITATISVTGVPAGTSKAAEILLRARAADSQLVLNQVKLEEGSVATPFQTQGVSIGEELALCQRYFVNKTGGAANLSSSDGSSSGGRVLNVWFPVQMRTTPSVDFSNNRWAAASASPTNKYIRFTGQPDIPTSTSYVTLWSADAEL